MKSNSLSKTELFKEVDVLQKKIEKALLPEGLKAKVFEMLKRTKRMARFGGYVQEFEKIAHYTEWILALPWQTKTEDILDLKRAKETMDKNHYGMDDIKERILEYFFSITEIRP